ncbi:hypothetical protein [Streptomyces sp. NBC_01235]|uniref:hypothetical protein n=1 Tax=Streptomyces sp. NBC_01235 TaxID=2903788 RepID=UPI002E1594A4|nr:hypothetical protein OG289_04340 [Streptomyces sp. NBC_01235]
MVDDSRVALPVDPAAFPAPQKDARYWTAGAFDPDPAVRLALNYDDGCTDYRKLTTG